MTLTLGDSGVVTYTRRLDILPGDVNDDGTVNTQDMVLLHSNFVAIAGPSSIYDINGDGAVDIND